MNRPDQSIATSPPKRKRYARALGSRLQEFGGSDTQVPPTSAESNDPVETQTSSSLHDCPALKHADDNIPLSDSDVPLIEVLPTSSNQKEALLFLYFFIRGFDCY